jgi:NSS family neurotransmitter:Na+ symporter
MGNWTDVVFLTALTEAVVCAVCDRSVYCAANRGFAAFCVCFLCWCLGLTMCTRGGYYVVDIVDAYVSRYTLTIAGEFIFIHFRMGN